MSTSATLTASTTSRPSSRHYVRAAELKAPGLDWTEVLAVEPDNPRARLAAELMANATHSRPIKQSGIARELARRWLDYQRRAEEV